MTKSLSVFLTCMLLCAFLLPTNLEAQPRIGQNSSVNISTNGKNTYKVRRPGYNLSIELKGDIVVNDDDTDIVSISRGGYIEVDLRDGGTRHRLRIEGLSGDRLSHRYQRNGRNIEFAEMDRDWYEALILKMVRELPIMAEERTARILAQSGVDGVLSEVEMIESSGAQTRYMLALFDQADLTGPELQRAAQTAAAIPSSGDKTRVLINSSSQFMANASATDAYFDAIATIPSSGDKTRALIHLTKEDMLDNEDAFIASVETAKGIPSSGDKARFLIAAAEYYFPGAHDAYFDVTATVPSSGDKTRVLLNLIEEGHLRDEPSFEGALEVAKAIPSSGDRARFLIAASPLYLDNARDAYFRAVNAIPSSGDHARVLINLGQNGDLDRASMLALLESARGVAASGDRARVLVSVAEDIAGDDELVEAYLNTAETIPSSGDQKRAMMALLN